MAINKEDKHLECVSDFCGNHRSPGTWADLYRRHDGSMYIALGGGWIFYAEYCPEIIEDFDPHFKPFLEACNKCEDFGYAKKHWKEKVASL